MEKTGVTAIDAVKVVFKWSDAEDDWYGERRGIEVTRVSTGEVIADIPLEEVTYEELIIDLLENLGFNVTEVVDNEE